MSNINSTYVCKSVSSPNLSIFNSTKNNSALQLLLIIIIIFLVVFLVGIIGYRHYFKMNGVDAVFNTSLTMTTLGIPVNERTDEEKLFTSIYAIFSQIFFVSLISCIIAYMFTMYYQKN